MLDALRVNSRSSSNGSSQESKQHHQGDWLTLFEVIGLAPPSPEEAVPSLAVPGATAVPRRM